MGLAFSFLFKHYGFYWEGIMGLFVPDYIFKNATHITPDFLREHGIRALVLDVDNTLTTHGSQHLSPEIEQWLALMRENGIKLSIVSNNVEKRVAPFAESIKLEHISFACKPLTKGLRMARERWGIPKSQMALVGDQIYTDGLAAGLYGIPILLVKPMAEDTKATIRLKRKLEKPFLLFYYKKGGELL